MASFKETGRVEQTIQRATPGELARQQQFSRFAFGGAGLGGGPSIAQIMQQIGGELTPAQRALIEQATSGGLARGFAPQLEAATTQIQNVLARRGLGRSSIAGTALASQANVLAPALGEAQRQAAQLQIGLPFQTASALQGLRGQQGGFAQFSLQRDLSERQSNFVQKQFKRKRGFFGRLGAALGGAVLGGLTGGLGTAIAGGLGGLFGGGGGGGPIPLSGLAPAFEPLPTQQFRGQAGPQNIPFQLPPQAAPVSLNVG